MCAIIAVMIVQLICALKPGLSDKLTSDRQRMLSKSVTSVVESWLSTVDNLVLVYRGFDVDVPCLKNDGNDDSKQTVASSRSYVWYDNDNKTVSRALTECVARNCIVLRV